MNLARKQKHLQDVDVYRELCQGLVVCVPTMNQTMNSGLTRLLMTTAQLGASMLTTDEMRPNEYARNIMAGMFLQRSVNCKRLWFVDNDMMPPNDALDLLKVPRGPKGGIVSARCVFSGGTRFIPGTAIDLAITFNGFKYIKGRKPPFEPVQRQAGDQEVDACGTASVIIDREVLEDRSIWYDGVYENRLTGESSDCSKVVANDVFIPPIFRAHYAPNGQPVISQDIDFSWRAKQAGYSVTYAHDIHFGHLKKMNMDVILDYVGSKGSQDNAKQDFVEAN